MIHKEDVSTYYIFLKV